MPSDTPSPGLLATSRRLHANRRYRATLSLAFVAGVALVFDALFLHVVPHAFRLGWSLTAGSMVVYVQVAFQASLGTFWSHPAYESLGVYEKARIWAAVRSHEYFWPSLVPFPLLFVGLVGVIAVRGLAIGVMAYAGLMLLPLVPAEAVYWSDRLSDEEYEREMDGG